ncbi:oligosaccharide flippase family protein [Glutamicibacter protophormiae]|uniref:oligosaccharide flippase family protein n=1 Tax=Glutamicibacter protophormiae TaxID=37930 RepID=UPI002A7FF9F8|nr:oligosaccharide flippase family protein [Glutamicibacter protophormiae]WPR66094.1 oligosaccharide flippase family protein [Glutamicibacter protophormiae]WPR69591.1 oligosaccharide flippase family protein [Glutamicibacter protophormiae]
MALHRLTGRNRRRGSGPAPGTAASGAAATAGGAFGWSLANTLVSRLGTLVIGVILARVLGPEEFGTFAIAMVALMAVLSFNELGVSLAIVRWPGEPGKIFSTVNTISVVGSVLFCAVAWLVAPAFTALMGDPQATLVVRLLILSVILNGVVAGPAALLQRVFREKERLFIDQANTWIGAGISVILALLGFGAMALAIGRLAGSLVAMVLFLRASPLGYRLGWSRQYVAPLLRFGLPLAGASIIVFATSYADQLTTGATLGTTALGFYLLAFNLSSWPLSIVSQPLRRVAPAAFSAIQSAPKEQKRVILALFTLVSCATAPAFGAIAGAAEPLIRMVYGSAWIPSAAVLSWLVVAAFSKVLCELAYDFIVVSGNTAVVLKLQGIGLLVSIPLMITGASVMGINGVAIAQVAVSFLVLLPMYLWFLRSRDIRLRDVLARIGLPFLAGVMVGGAAALLARFVANPLLAVLGAAGISVAVIVVLVYLRRVDLAAIRTITRTETEMETR